MQGYPPGVNGFRILLPACLLLFPACREKAREAVVTETRPVTTRDQSPKVDATSDERFRDARPSPVQAETPPGWLALPPSQFRLLNYRFGESGMGEVWVSIASGGVLDNVNRWLNQFAAPAIDDAGLAKLRTVPVAGTAGTWVEATGEYASGMGAAPKSGYALAGVVASVGGRIVTVKMVGPEAEVRAAHGAIEKFANDLKLVE